MLISRTAGDIGSSLMRALQHDCTPVGLDLESASDGRSVFAVDLACGVPGIALELRRDPLRQHHARWDKLIV
jgi:hypothetical protein